MRRYIIFLFIIVSFLSCIKEPIHSIRIRNEFKEDLLHVIIGDKTPYGTIETGETTSYSAINTGTYKISGKTPSGLILNGNITVEGSKGTPMWTIVVLENGKLQLIRDK